MSATKKRRTESGEEHRPSFKVAVVAGEGGLTSSAAHAYFKESPHELVKGETMKACFKMVADGAVKYTIVPIENSMSGALQGVLDLLLQFNLFIVGECAQVEEHSLLGLEGGSLDNIESVLSHPHLLAQSSFFLDSLEEKAGKPLDRVCVNHSMQAVETVLKAGDKTKAAIGPPSAVKFHPGLKVLQSNIENYKGIKTRYIVLAKTHCLPLHTRSARKRSICVSLGNKTGAFHRAFAAFGFRNMNVFRVECRPCSSAFGMVSNAVDSIGDWDYVYHIDYEPAPDAKTNEALIADLQSWCLALRDFGTYERSVELTGVQRSIVAATFGEHNGTPSKGLAQRTSFYVDGL